MDDQRPLTVIQLLTQFDGGGEAQTALDLAAELVRRGHRAVVISPPGRLVPYLTGRGGRHIPWPMGTRGIRAWWWASRLRGFLDRERADILHARSLASAWIAYRAWRGMDAGRRPRLVTSAVDFYSSGAETRVVARGECVIAVSEAVKRHLLEHCPGIGAERIEIIYRGVDERVFPYGYRPDIHWLQQWYRQYPQLIDRYLITLPGPVSPRKGHDVFVDLIGRLRSGGVDAYGLIVGDEDPRYRGYVKTLRRRVTEKHVEHVIFTGYRSDIRNLLSISNLVVSLSPRPEPFSRAVLESLQLGIPVAGYDHGGVGELLMKLFPEGRIPAGDVEKLRAKVVELIKRPPHVAEFPQLHLARTLDEAIRVYQRLSRPQRHAGLAAASN